MRADRVVIYDPDGLNPYGRELGVLLGRRNVHVDALTASDAEWRPVGARPVLPSNRPGSPRWRQLLRLLQGLAFVTWRCLLCREPCIVVLTRSLLDEAWLAALAVLRAPIVLVMHGPNTTGVFISPARRFALSVLRWRAWRRVAHSEQLAAVASQMSRGRAVSTIPILPFLGWWADNRVGVERAKSGLVLGHLRPDKGLDALRSIVRRLPVEARPECSVYICGRGELAAELLDDLRGCVPVVNRSSTEYVSDEAIATALGESSLLLAPYWGVTQSATVALALTAGLRVIAFDDGALRDLIDDDGLVEAGDFDSFAERWVAAVRGEAGSGRRDLDDWEEEVGDRWCALVRRAESLRGGRARLLT